MLAVTPRSRVTTHAADEDDENDEDLCVVVIIAALVVVIEIADWCFGGLGCWGSSARRAGGDDGHGDDACVWWRRVLGGFGGRPLGRSG
jgi:hypothetical protein